MKCPKGAAVRDDLADGEVSRRLDNSPTSRFGWFNGFVRGTAAKARLGRVSGNGCARALELARRAPGFGFGHTAARWPDAAGCTSDHRRLDRDSEPGNEHEKRRHDEAGANHGALVSGRKGSTLTLHGEYAYDGALGCAATPQPVRSETKRTRGKTAWRARVGEGGDTCKKFPSTA
jgi:hypothetical protein